jgi:squalene-hopene/tetraprenyl-beta-curcumene cyclase
MAFNPLINSNDPGVHALINSTESLQIPRTPSAIYTLTSLLCLLVIALSFEQSPAESQSLNSRSAEWDRAAAADYLDGRQTWWQTWTEAERDHETSCVSCHLTVGYALARPKLRPHLGETNLSFPEMRLLEDVERRVALWTEVDPFYPDQRVGLPKTSESRGVEAILNALILSNRDAQAGQLTSETREAFENLWKLQFTRGEAKGSWAWLYFNLAPWESEGAAYFGAALAAVAVGIAPDEYASSTEIQDRVDLLRAYLQQDSLNRPPFDQVMLLWASSELPDLMTQEQKQSTISDIVRLQNSDGGWSLPSLGRWESSDEYSPDPDSDGYATGLVTFVLQKAGELPVQENISRALDWLVQNQDLSSGRWPSTSLNKERDPTSDRGLIMADAATGFAVLALMQAESSNE